MTTERIEWVEIIEPRTKEHMYANLTTGECVWDPPEGVPIKRADSSQWWELFDTNTQRFYYYNVASQTTVWHRPNNCDIIPLAKLQTLKQNTDPGDKRDCCTQTSHSKVRLQKTASRDSHHRHHSSSGGHARVQSAGASDAKSSSELLSSPHGRHSYRLPSSDTSLAGKSETYRYCRHSQGSTTSHGSHKHKDSGKSSDSSISSAHGYRRLHEGGSLRISNSQQHKNKHLSDNSYRILQESSSSHNIPHVPYGTAEKHQQHYPHSKLSYSISNSSDLGGLSPTHSANTPILKKKLSSESSIHSKRDSCGGVSKHQSFDYTTGNAAIVSLTRSGSFMSSPTSAHHHPASLQGSLSPQQQQQSLSSSHRKANNDGNGGGSDDSMHEKYFKSVENTPVSRRRHTTSAKLSNKKHSSDSSPQSPISPQNHTQSNKSARPSVLSSLSALEPPPSMCYNMSSSHKNDPDFINLDLTTKPEKYLDKMKLDKRSPNASYSGGGSGSGGSGIIHSSHSPIGGGSGMLTSQDHHQQKINNSKSPIASGGIKNSAQIISSSQYPAVEKYNKSLDQYASRSNTDRQNKEPRNSERSTGKHRKKHHPANSDAEYDNGNISPLYSNWDQEMQEHLLPLQHYIIEQAKLSGCYGFGDTIDSDSFHSDSQSEHSLSGHEPDNEDSDHSDGHGDYLTHSYGLMGDYESNMGDGVSYYNYYMGYDHRNDREDISDNVEAVLENEKDTQIYSPVRGHPFYLSSVAQQQPKPLLPPHQLQQQQLQMKIPSPQRHIPVPELREPLKSKPNDDNLSQSQKSNASSHLSSLSLSVSSGTGGGTGGLGATKGGNVSQLAIMKECDIEKFAQDNINLHSKGIFRKKSSLRDMLSWTANAISRPMLALARDKAGKKMATELFKLVQIYMGDRKARAGMSLNSVAIDIINTALGQQQLRDELYVQLCRQTTENPKRESLIRGWELMAICLSYVPPSPTFQPALLNYMNRHRDPTFATSFPDVGKWPIHVQISHYATVCCRRLDRIGNSKRPTKKPTDDEIEQARGQILRDSMFGNTLHEVMELQKDKYPERKLPWIQVTLSEQVLLLNGKQTEGIFRVSADVDEVNCLKSRLDRWEVPEHKNTMDAHAPASLLKLWYRELYDPLIPDELYYECVQTEDPDEADRIINKLPSLNKLVLMYLVHFLQQFAQPDVVQCTKMDSSNLAMVFAPNCLRCTSDDPKIILENARKEMAFMRTLIQNMDTTSVANLV